MSSLPKKGDIFPTRYHGDVTVVEYVNSNHVKVIFQDNTEKVVANKELRNGVIKNNFQPNVYGVGYLGEGEFSSSKKGKLGVNGDYSVWSGILRRCYDSKFQTSHPSYIGCYVCDEWHNFQNFAGWLRSQIGYSEGWHVDKDILAPQNKCYAPSTCVLVPQEINNLLTLRQNCRGSLPLGVTKGKSGRYHATMSKDKGSLHLGTFDTPQLAFDKYKFEKESRIKEFATKYKGQLAQNTYAALLSYNISIED